MPVAAVAAAAVAAAAVAAAAVAAAAVAAAVAVSSAVGPSRRCWPGRGCRPPRGPSGAAPGDPCALLRSRKWSSATVYCSAPEGSKSEAGALLLAPEAEWTKRL